MAKVRQYLGVYESMEFPEYKFTEYPKVVGYKDEKKQFPIIVGDAKEEVEYITKGEPGSFKTREDELQAELERKAVELELAKTQLAELKAQKELAETAKPKPSPANSAPSNKPALNVKDI
jgi:hypothetical protein